MISSRSLTLVFSLIFSFTFGAIARDFELDTLPESENLYNLKSDCDGRTYYSFVDEVLKPKMIELAGARTRRMPNEEALRSGKGVGIKLNAQNYNFHINFPNSEQGGRSYGWTKGKVGDWSDKMYLDFLSKVVVASDTELSNFYESAIEMLASCSVDHLSKLSFNTQRVATNFLAIYTAEQYRAMVGRSNWDDALLQVTLVAAFHGGQETLTKYFAGEFSDKAIDQSECVYKKASLDDSEVRSARLNDYWQFGRTAEIDPETGRCTGRSGINITRSDFEKMGAAITKYESTVAKSKLLKSIEAVVGKGPNALKNISQYFTNGEATPAEANALAKNVAKFMVQIREHANEITEWIQNNE